MPQTNKVRETRDPSTLKPFPLQEQIHGPPNQEKVDELANDIQSRGLQHPIEILPDGTVLCGHHRLAAVIKLGKTEVPVIVRNDLAAAPPAEQRRHFLKDNLLRNHHGPLAQARMIIALDDSLGEPGEVTGRHRDYLAKKLLQETDIDVSGKTIDRRLKLLELPIAIQHLVDDGTITQAKALKVAYIPVVPREELAEAVIQSADPAAKLDELLAEKNQGRTTTQTLDGLARRLIRLCNDVHELDFQRGDELVERVTNIGIDPLALQSLQEIIGCNDEATTEAA